MKIPETGGEHRPPQPIKVMPPSNYALQNHSRPEQKPARVEGNIFAQYLIKEKEEEKEVVDPGEIEF